MSSPLHQGFFLGLSMPTACAPGTAFSRGRQKTAPYCHTSLGSLEGELELPRDRQ